MGHKAVGPVSSVMHVKVSSALIVKRRGSPLCSLSDWHNTVPQQLVNHYIKLKGNRSGFHKELGLVLSQVRTSYFPNLGLSMQFVYLLGLGLVLTLCEIHPRSLTLKILYG